MTPEELVGQRVAEIRDRLGMTQQQLGEHLGPLLGRPWPRQTVSAAEKGKRAFTAAELVALAHVLDTWAGRFFVPTAAARGLIELPGGATVTEEQLTDTATAGARNVLAIALGAVRTALDQAEQQATAGQAAVKELSVLYDALTAAAPITEQSNEDGPA